MIGIGKWNVAIKSKIFNGGGTFEIFDDDGKYGFKLCEADLGSDKYLVKEIKEEGNNLTIALDIPSIPFGKNVVTHASFNGDALTGYADLPLIGRIEITGEKII